MNELTWNDRAWFFSSLEELNQFKAYWDLSYGANTQVLSEIPNNNEVS